MDLAPKDVGRKTNTTLQVGDRRFLSIACGASRNFTDELNLQWVPDTEYISTGVPYLHFGNFSKNQSVQHLRQFPNNSKSCYAIPTTPNTRYLVRASFYYNSFDMAITSPIFDKAINATTFSTVRIIDPSFVYRKEVIAFSPWEWFSICLLNTNQGYPFISSLELRPLPAGMYGLPYLDENYLVNQIRLSFGAPVSVRYPDDPQDRIWYSDSYPVDLQPCDLQNILPPDEVEVISTSQQVEVNGRKAPDQPPMLVMQRGVVGKTGNLTYRYHLDDFDFPGQAYALAYFAEIEELNANKKRSFHFTINSKDATYINQSLDIQSNAGGPYVAFEPSYANATFPRFVLSFGGVLTDGEAVGDPCLPIPWDWVTCTTQSPPRVKSINLAGRNLGGSIPSNISLLVCRDTIDLSGNQFSGPIPDLRDLTYLNTLSVNLQTYFSTSCRTSFKGIETARRQLHLNNNNLSGEFPEWPEELPNLTEVWVQNNVLTGAIPQALLKKPSLRIRSDLCNDSTCENPLKKKGLNMGALITGLVLSTVLLIGVFTYFQKHRLKDRVRGAKAAISSSSFLWRNFASRSIGSVDETTEIGPPALTFDIAELRKATNNFKYNIGKGGFGSVFRGKLNDGTEVAVKVLANDSPQGAREFRNEVTLLQGIKHRNVVSLIGYCSSKKHRIVVYEYLPEGSLHERLHGHFARTLVESITLDWQTRLRIAVDAAKGLEYLHAECSIIHRGVKTRNILLSSGMEAKVGDFGLSCLLPSDATSYKSSTVQGTVGYLDPEYYHEHRLTMMSDVYSFGVVLLELISGRPPMSRLEDGITDQVPTLVNWVCSLLQRAAVDELIDPKLGYASFIEREKRQAWEVWATAIQYVRAESRQRPTMSEVVKALSETLNPTHPATQCDSEAKPAHEMTDDREQFPGTQSPPSSVEAAAAAAPHPSSTRIEPV
ncbi:probable LRR receptor-like serine/threonine-protein kinase At1g67720 [Physcomitrium patens]